MRKNLFLTLALILASFAGATAQNWSVTLGSAEGLPGVTATLDGGNVKYFKSGIIRAEKPIKTLRFTCAANSTSHKPNGNNARMMLSELNVYTADMSRELAYTVVSNADHNTLAQAFDGQGLKALYDGKYNNYFSSMSAADGAVADYHYLELTFEEEISRFIIEWAGKQGSGEAPSVVVLTEGGVAAEPYADRSTSFSDSKITKLEDLVAAEYFTIRGNAPASYHTYDNKTGEQTSKEPLEGSGPMYVVLGDNYAKEPALDYLTQLVPAGEGKYYLYFPMQQKYLSADAAQNALNEALNGWQYATADKAKAAVITFTALANGDFEMSYTTDTNVVVYIGADPRTGKMKIFATDRKKALEANGWCQGFGLICAFNWSFYGADYSAPAWAKEYEIGNVYINAKRLKEAIAGYEVVADYAEGVEELVASLEETLAALNEMDAFEINAAYEQANAALANILFDVENEEGMLLAEYFWMNNENEDNPDANWGYWADNSGDKIVPGMWSQSAFNQYIQPGMTLIENVLNVDIAVADAIEDIIEYFEDKESNVAAFYASEYKALPLPLTYTTDQVALGVKEGNAYVWEQNIILKSAKNSLRFTFTETNVGNAAGGGKHNGYPMVALGELEIFTADGEKLALDAAKITTNSQETSEGPMTNLVDGDAATFWHSIWGNGNFSPVEEVYLAIELPQSVDKFTVKITGRDNASLSPKTVVVSDYDKKWNVVDAIENPYNVAIGEQVTNIDELEDGGLYVLQGNLNVNKTEGAAKPRYYSGTAPYSDSKVNAADAPCVYKFTKNNDGTWNILSVSKGQYWNAVPEYGTSNMTLYKAEAGNVKFVSSGNIENAFVIYRDIEPTTVKGSFNGDVTIPETDITQNVIVYMDWDNGLASRPCYSALPGEVAPGCEALTDDLKVNSSAGDYLHFNKTNGEGEWKIYKATADDLALVYLAGVTETVEALSLTPGNNPGCVKATAEQATAFDNALAAAQVVINTENLAGANAAAANLINAVEVLKSAPRVGFDSSSVYQIQSGLNKYLENTWATRSVYADNESGTYKWTVSPTDFNEVNYEFLFKVIVIDEEINTVYRLGLDESQLGKQYIIKMFDRPSYAGAFDEANNNFLVAAQPVAYKINDLGECDFEIIESANNKYWHTEGHSEGNGYKGRLVNWNCGNNLNSASAWTFINMGNLEETAIEDLVIEGDEVVSVQYFTPAGTAIPAPAKGINIVVTVYANGVVEAKKKVVK